MKNLTCIYVTVDGYFNYGVSTGMAWNTLEENSLDLENCSAACNASIKCHGFVYCHYRCDYACTLKRYIWGPSPEHVRISVTYVKGKL